MKNTVINSYDAPKIERKIDKDLLNKYDWPKSLDKIKNDNDTSKDKETSKSS